MKTLFTVHKKCVILLMVATLIIAMVSVTMLPIAAEGNLLIDIENHQDSKYSNAARSSCIIMGNGNDFSTCLGEIDLSQYVSVVISYGGDTRVPVADLPMALTATERELGAKDRVDDTNLLASTTMTAIEKNYTPNVNIVAISLKDTDYKGEVYLSIPNVGNNYTFQIYSVEFISASVGGEEETVPDGQATPLYTFKTTDQWLSGLSQTQIKNVDTNCEWLGTSHYFLEFNGNTEEENYIYIGDYDLSRVGLVTFEVTTESGAAFGSKTELRFVTGADCETVIASVPAMVGEGWSSPVDCFTVFDTDYNGSVYLTFYDGGAKDTYRVANFEFFAVVEEEDFVFPPMETTADTTPVSESQTNESENATTQPADTKAETEVNTAEVTGTDTENEQQTQSQQSGNSCQSVMVCFIGLPVLAVAVCIMRKKED